MQLLSYSPSALFFLTSRRLQLALTTASVVLGLATVLPAGHVNAYFTTGCFLYANMTVRLELRNNLTTVVIVQRLTTYGKQSTCQYVVFLPVFVLAHAVIWLWFRIHMRRILQAEWREAALLPIMLVMFTVYTVCLIFSCTLLSQGSQILCDNLKMEGSKVRLTCSALQKLPWACYPDPKRPKPFYTYLRIAEVSGWLLLLTMAARLVAVVVRCYYDFFSDLSFWNEYDSPALSTHRHSSVNLEEIENAFFYAEMHRDMSRQSDSSISTHLERASIQRRRSPKSFSERQSHSQSRSQSHNYSPSHSHAHSPSMSHTHSHSQSQSPTHSPTHSHTHNHTHSQSHSTSQRGGSDTFSTVEVSTEDT